VERFFQFYDKDGEQFAPLRARRPEAEEVEALTQQSFEEVSVEHFVVIRPASEFALGGNWFLNARQGFSNSEGTHRLVESRLDPIGHLFPFEIGEISTENRFDEPLRIEVRHNKPRLHSDFDAAKLAEFISVSPEVENFKVDSDWRKFVLDGDFSYGIDYRVTIRDGILANDTTQLAQVFSAAASFEPQPGFVTFPAFRTTQNASGHRRFDIRTGNLTGLRTRVKSLDGDDLIMAMREYDEKYEGWGEKEALAFASIPGATIHDQFHDATADLDRTETVSLDWDELVGGTATGAYYLCAEGNSSTRDNHRVGAHSLVQLTDIGLAWKQSAESTLIYAFSLKSGTPLPDLLLRLVDGNAASSWRRAPTRPASPPSPGRTTGTTSSPRSSSTREEGTTATPSGFTGNCIRWGSGVFPSTNGGTTFAKANGARSSSRIETSTNRARR
jgi:alpha-2-macroglobulin